MTTSVLRPRAEIIPDGPPDEPEETDDSKESPHIAVDDPMPTGPDWSEEAEEDENPSEEDDKSPSQATEEPWSGDAFVLARGSKNGPVPSRAA